MNQLLNEIRKLSLALISRTLNLVNLKFLNLGEKLGIKLVYESERLISGTVSDGLETGVLSSAGRLFQSNVIRNFLIYSAGALSVQAAHFFLIPIYTRVLSPNEYGQLALLNMFIGLAATILGLGLAPTVTIFYFKVHENIRFRTITNIIFLYTIVALPIIVLMLFGTSYISKYIFDGQIPPHLIIIAIMVIFFSFFQNVYLNVLKMEERARKRTLLQVGIGLFTMFLNIYLVYYRGVGIAGILVTSLLSLIIILLIGAGEYLYKFKKIMVNLRLNEIKDFLKVGLPIVPGSLSMWALLSADRWILMNYVSLADVGIYSLAYSFGMVWQSLLLVSFAAAYTPRLYRAYKDNLIETEKKNMRVLRYYLGLSLILVIVAMTGIYFVFPFLIGAEFQASYPFIWIILMGYVFYGGFSFCNHFPYILKKTYYATFCGLIGLGINVGLNLLFIPKYGILAAAYTTMFSFLIMFILGFILRTRLFRKMTRAGALPE